MTVTRAAIKNAVSRLSVHYKGSLPDADAISATAVEYHRCLERMAWCDDETFLAAVDYVIDHEHTNGFLPEWSLIRDKALSLCRSTTAQRMANRQIDDTRRRGTYAALFDVVRDEHNNGRATSSGDEQRATGQDQAG